jgi:hypothetical protein
MSSYIEECEQKQELINLGAEVLAGMVLELRLERDILLREVENLKNLKITKAIKDEDIGHNPT